MRTLRWWPALAALALAALVTGSGAQDKKSIAEKHDSQALANSLRDVINTGADLFNLHGDYAGCYRVYQGGLLSIKPFLTPALQNKIDQTIEKAERMPRFSDRAFELRALIDEIRAASKGPAPVAPKKEEMKGGLPKEVKKTEPKKEEKKTEPKKEDKKVEPKKEDKAPAVVDPNAGQVMGKVVYLGKPAPPGFITLIGADKRRFSTSIAADGTYVFKTPIPPGMYRIALERVPGAKIPANLDLPERYRSENTSGLTIDVLRGKQMFDLNLVK